MRRKNLLKELGIQKQADISCNALDIDTPLYNFFIKKYRTGFPDV